MDDLALVEDVRTQIAGRTDPEAFRVAIIPRIFAAIEQAKTVDEANQVRAIANMAQAYLRQALPKFAGNRRKAFEKMLPMEEAYLRASARAGALWAATDDRRGPGGDQRSDHSENSHNDRGWQEAGFMYPRDAITCARLAELDEEDLRTYVEWARENGKHATLGGAERVWRMFHGGSPKELGKLQTELVENDEVRFWFWALSRPLTGSWGSGAVWARMCQEVDTPDAAFGVRDNIPAGVAGIDLSTGYDWNKLPFKEGHFRFGYWDPPYDQLYKKEGQEIWRVCRKLAILHTHIWPRSWLKGAKRTDMAAITMGPMKQIRCLQVFEKAV